MRWSRQKKRDIFQFTPLREGRRHTEVEMEVHSNFNSRPSARGDLSFQAWGTVHTISIHAPPRGATCHQRRWNPAIRFQFTPLREGRRELSQHLTYDFISIHAPPRGATPHNRLYFRHHPHFNSRPSARGDGNVRVIATPHIRISIHAPPRGATGKR